MPQLLPEFTMWFDVPKEYAPGRVEIMHIPDGGLQDIIMASTSMHIIYQDDGPPVRESEHHLDKDANLVLCQSVISWEQFEDVDGEELPCIDKNKLLYARQGWFRPFITDCRIKIAAEFKKHQEIKTKN